MNHDDDQRGTGRSTGLILEALSQAILKPLEPAVFVDHWQGRPTGLSFARTYWRPTIARTIERLGLSGFLLIPQNDGSVRIIYDPKQRKK